MSHLLDWYGFHGTLLILGACLLNVCVSAALYRPLATHVIIIRNEERKKAKLDELKNKNITENPPDTNVSTVVDINKQVDDDSGEEKHNNNKDDSAVILDTRSEDGSIDIPRLSSSLPNNTLTGTPSSAHKFINDECSLAHNNKRNSLHSSF